MKNTYLLRFYLVLLAAVFGSPALVSAQFINTIAGNGSSGYIMDGVPATGTKINNPNGLCVDNAHNVYFADYNNHRIRKIDAYGVITTIAGTGTPGYSGDTGPATAATLNRPSEVILDNAGNIIISEYYNHAIRKIDPSGIITTICGNGSSGSFGDGGLAVSALISYPMGLFITPAGDLYFCDANNHNIRKINAGGYISHIAGNGTPGYSGDGFAASTAQLHDPYNVAVDNAGNVYISDQTNDRVRMINTSGIINTIVGGTGIPGYSGDGGSAFLAQISRPTGLRVDPTGTDIYFTDRSNFCVRKVSSGIISTIIGTGTVSGFFGDGGPATAALFTQTSDLTVDFATGTVYVSDFLNSRIRRTSTCALPPTVAPITTASVVCVGATASSSFTTPGGQWSISNSHASIGSISGIVTGLSSGTATISYSVTNDCGSSGPPLSSG